MYIKTYLNDSTTFQQQKKPLEGNLLTNRAQSKKELKKQNNSKVNNSQNLQVTSFKRFIQKQTDSPFDDQIFTALYKINRKLSYQRCNTFSDKSQPTKISFKLNYVENNHKPNIKQKIVSKLNHLTNTKQKNPPKQQNKGSLPDSKKSKIENYISKNNDPAIIKFTNINQQKNFSIKERLIKSGQKNDNNKISFEIDRFRTLSSHRIRSSFGNYDAKILFDSSRVPNNCLTPEKLKHKSSLINDLPQYVQNIIKPCKIQGIELIDRPFTSIGRRLSLRNGKPSSNESTQKKLSLKVQRQDDQQNIRTIKTARQAYRGVTRLDQSRRQNPQRQRNKKKLYFEPWGQQQQINLSQDHDILFSLE